MEMKDLLSEIGTFLFRFIPVVLFVTFGYLTFVATPGVIDRKWLMPMLAAYALSTLSVIEEKLSVLLVLVKFDIAVKHQGYMKEARKQLGINNDEQA